jgi:hypothetical protein
LSGYELITRIQQSGSVYVTLKTISGKNGILILLTLCSATLVWLAYEMSIERAHVWGSLVKAAFDCYLPDLAKRLGYKLPTTGADQRRFWIAVSRRAIYNRPFRPEDWPGANEEKDSTISGKGQEGIVDEARRDSNEAETAEFE